MCIETINQNRTQNGYKAITGSKNKEELELLMPNATYLLTFKQWNKEHRVVIKGQHGFKLRGASTFKNKKGDEETKFYNFTVFDISQTRPMTDEEIEKYNEKISGAKK